MKGKIEYDEKGKEIHNGTPVRMPVGFHRPTPLADTINRLVDRRLAQGGASEADETFEEAQDFDCGPEPEDRMPPGGWEIGDDQPGATMTPEVPTEPEMPPAAAQAPAAGNPAPDVPAAGSPAPAKDPKDENPST